jgi:hypothetical protein
MLENITREIKEDQEKARKETKELRLELSSDLKEALRHFDSKINSLDWRFCCHDFNKIF